MSKAMNITGWIFSALIAAVFLMGAYVQLSFDPATANSASPVNYPAWFHTMVGSIFIAAVALHLTPKSAFALLGAILMSVSVGGFIATHVLIGDGQWPTRVVIGILPWLGLYLRDARFNELMSFWRS